MLYSSVTALKLQVQRFGKPFPATYQYAEDLLHEQVRARWQADAQSDGETVHVPLRRIYAIGDNPLSDIKGANERGAPWHSILVCTGCHVAEENDTLFPAHHFCQDAYAAVQYILERERALQRECERQ
jgi:ribonucleotide monophosphatase NagD (HAD superfamily)